MKLSKDFFLLLCVGLFPIFYIIFFNILDRTLGLRGFALSITSAIVSLIIAFFLYFLLRPKSLDPNTLTSRNSALKIVILILAFFASIYLVMVVGMLALSLFVFKISLNFDLLYFVLTWPIRLLK